MSLCFQGRSLNEGWRSRIRYTRQFCGDALLVADELLGAVDVLLATGLGYASGWYDAALAAGQTEIA